jgi:hypothetical protein
MLKIEDLVTGIESSAFFHFPVDAERYELCIYLDYMYGVEAESPNHQLEIFGPDERIYNWIERHVNTMFLKFRKAHERAVWWGEDKAHYSESVFSGLDGRIYSAYYMNCDSMILQVLRALARRLRSGLDADSLNVSLLDRRSTT